jgi:hypothetical protein
MARYTVRITKFRDRAAFRAVVEFLARLYPDRQPRDFEVALARLPCLVSHDADEEAARTLDRALRKRGADLRIDPVSATTEAPRRHDVSMTAELSPEIDLSFLDESRRKKNRSLPDSSEFAGPEEGKAPWEQ